MAKAAKKAASKRKAPAELGESSTDTEFGRELIGAVKEAGAYLRGEIDLPAVEHIDAARVKQIRKRFASSPAVFEQRFGVPRRTLEGWEAGRKLDVAGRLLLQVIDREPDAVERALKR